MYWIILYSFAMFRSVVFNLGSRSPTGVVNHFWRGRE